MGRMRRHTYLPRTGKIVLGATPAPQDGRVSITKVSGEPIYFIVKQIITLGSKSF